MPLARVIGEAKINMMRLWLQELARKIIGCKYNLLSLHNTLTQITLLNTLPAACIFLALHIKKYIYTFCSVMISVLLSH